MTAIFVTATGTAIGKTYVTARLIRNFRAAGRTVEALKPVATGFDPDDPAGSDPALLLDALDRPATLDDIAAISPWRYRAPLSPDMAARLEGHALDFAALGAFCRRAIRTRHDVLLIEGIGGVMVPLDDTHTVLDWMVMLRLPLILVAGSYLGTLSHTLTAVDALTRRDLHVLSVVVNESAESSVPLVDTAATIRRFVHPIEVITLPRARAAVEEDALGVLLGADARRVRR